MCRVLKVEPLSALQEKTEEEEFSIGPLSVLYNSVKSNSQVSPHVQLAVTFFGALEGDGLLPPLMREMLLRSMMLVELGHVRQGPSSCCTNVRVIVCCLLHWLY